ncbi:MAG: ATPase domain-containing protein [Candidatus Micrarchaeia archaeon]
MNRVKTGIPGIDAMLYGGIPEGNQVIIAGGPGTGKTLFSFEFLYKNAKEGNPGIFFALEESPKDILRNVKNAFTNFTDIDDLIKKSMITINGDIAAKLSEGGDDSQTYEFGKIVSEIEGEVSAMKAKRVVIDSLSLFDILVTDPLIYRRSTVALISNLRRIGVTSLLTSEIQNPERNGMQFKQEFFIYDGIISMYMSGEQNKRDTTLEIIKMRGSKHSFATAPYEITPDGFKVFSAEESQY